jgi:hypothetical protein
VGPTCQPAGEREKVEWAGGEGLGRKLCLAEQGRWEKRKRRERREGGPRGILGQAERERERGREGLVFDLFFSFLFFKSFLAQTFKPFQIQIFTQLFTNFFIIIFKTFHKYFKTFKTTPQPKLMHFNMMHKHLGDSNY